MVHLQPDRKTKKSFIEDLKNGTEFYVDQPGFFPISNNGTGVFVIEAPANYHKWYSGVLKNTKRISRL